MWETPVPFGSPFLTKLVHAASHLIGKRDFVSLQLARLIVSARALIQIHTQFPPLQSLNTN